MPPAKVLFPYVGGSVGGSHVSSLLLARVLPPERYEPVVAIHEEGPLEPYLRSLGITPLLAPRVAYADRGGSLARGLRRVRAAGPLSRFIDRHGIDIVHTNDMRMHMTWGAAAKKANAAHVWHQRSVARAAKHARAALRAQALLTVSEYCAASFPPAMRAAAQVVYNPFTVGPLPDRTAAHAQLRSKLGLEQGARCVVFVANLAPQKRPQHFVALAAELVAKGFDDTHFVMLGDSRGHEGDAVRAAISAAGLEDRFHLPGPCHPVELWLSGADLLIAPAVAEAFGRVLVEAQLLKTPVLASDAGGHREIVQNGRTGLLARPDDVGAFCAATATLLNDRKLAARLAHDARQSAVERFSTQRHVKAMLKIYDALIGLS